MSEKFYKNTKVEQLTKMFLSRGEEKGLIVKDPFVYDFVLMYHRASLSVVILQQFLLELCLFVNLEYSKYSVFRTFLLHGLNSIYLIFQ